MVYISLSHEVFALTDEAFREYLLGLTGATELKPLHSLGEAVQVTRNMHIRQNARAILAKLDTTKENA